MSTVLITGNTYPVKEQIKALGGKWDADEKGWRVPAEKADAAQALVGNAPSTPRKSYRPHKCRCCGAIPSKPGQWQNGVRIRRDGICWDCATDD